MIQETSSTYRVSPSYCIGDNEPFDLSAEGLRTFLLDELDQATEPGGERTRPDLSLAKVLSLGDDLGDSVRFDVTRRGCLESTLFVSASLETETSK